ncbi:MAG: PEP-CTERM system TPR-repeat protein PrsT [Gammaproteobacteria bacterium]|jgi:putative PEP-CTERM system TPR-repeat lipoprotein|nr:PEP-CTERM system TPR-repeat protein PrsT [Gammaproteobacteria bacterium]
MHSRRDSRPSTFGRNRNFATLLTAVLLVTACNETTYSADEHVARAQQAYAEGKVRQAVIEIKNALQQEPTRAEARRLLGEYNLDLGKAVEAETELVRAEELGGDPDKLRLPLLRAWLMQGKNDEVIEATETLQVSEKVQQADALTVRAQALMREGQIESARAALEQTLALDSGAAEARLSMAWVEWLDKKPDAARTQLRAALEADPSLSRAWELLGDVERDAGELDEAEAAYAEAIETSPVPFSPLFKRALTRLLQEDYEAAGQDVEALQEQFEEHPAVSYVRGLIAFHQQRYQDARTELEESLSLDPNYLPALFYLGATQYALENWQQAEVYLSRYTRRVPASSEAARLLALARLQGGDSERAKNALNLVLQQDPEDRAALGMMSNLYLAQGRADEALHHLRKVIAMEPDSAATRAQLGIALLQKGEREEGFSELDRAIELTPDGAPRLEIAIILERLRSGEVQQALERLERLQERDAIAAGLYYNLKGIAHAGLGDMETARATFSEGLAKVPPEQKPDLANNLARIMARSGENEEAQELLTETLAESPDHLGLLFSLARLKAGADDFTGSQSLLERAVSAHPAALQPRLALAELHLIANRPTDALRVLREAEQQRSSEQDSNRPAGWLSMMATALLNTGDREAAAEMLSELHEQRPDAANVSFMLGRLLIEQGDRNQARALLEEALQEHPDHLGIRVTIVELLTLEDRLDEATEYLAVAQESHPDHPQVLARAGAIAFEQDSPREAVDRFQRALEQAPNDRYITRALAQAQLKAGDAAAAVETLSDWLERVPNDDGMRMLQANLLLQLGRDQEAVDAFQQLLNNGQENPVVLNNLAWLLRDTDPKEAIRLAEQAVKAEPESGQILDTKGVIELKLGRHASAVESFRRALALSPGIPSIRLHLAEALIAEGERKDAREELNQLLGEDLQTENRKKAERLLQQL